MLTRILSKIGLPVLVKFVSSSLGSLNNDLAQKAVQALGEVDNAISKEQISLEELKEANRHLEKLQELENSLDASTLQLIHNTIKNELQSEDKFVRFWRPAFGYSVAITWLISMLTICYVIINNSVYAAEILTAMVETTSLWGIALGVLGISVVRSTDSPNAYRNNILNKITHLKNKH